MTALSFACVICLVAADSATPSPTSPASAQRRYHEIERDLNAALRRESSAKELSERAAAVRELAVLFTEVRRDSRTAVSPVMQEYRAKLRARLVNVQTRLKKEIARTQPAARRDALADPVPDDAQRELAAQVAAQVSLAHYSLGGPGRLFDAAGAAGGGAVIGDNGQELVDLIQRTIAPDAWDISGGPCRIVYYRPLMCLVVTATGDIHRDVGNLLPQLRGP